MLEFYERNRAMKKTIGVIFSGYGEQFIGMGKDLYDESRKVQDLFEQASMCLDTNFVQLCFAASQTEMMDIDKGYVAIVLFQSAIYSQLAQAGLRPDFIAGYGIGEYTAAIASGSLSFSDGIYLLSKYAQLFYEFLTEHPDFAILFLPRGFDSESIEQLCKDFSTQEQQVFVAAYNSENTFYIAGDVQIIAQIKEYCKDSEIRKVKELPIGYELHSKLVDNLVDVFAPYFFKVDFKSLRIPVITNVDGVYVTSSDALESAIKRRVNSPVLWQEVMDGFVGCDVLLCVGPGSYLFDLAVQKYPEKEIYLVQTLADLQGLETFLQEHRAGFEGLVQEDGQIILGTCHVHDEVISLPQNLTDADLLNELPGDYDIDEDHQ